MSDNCMGCAMKDVEIRDLKAAASRQQSMFTNIFCDLLVDLESDDLESALETVKEMVGERE